MTITVEIKHGGGQHAVRIQNGNGVLLATLAPGEISIQYVWPGSRPLVIVEGDPLPVAEAAPEPVNETPEPAGLASEG